MTHIYRLNTTWLEALDRFDRLSTRNKSFREARCLEGHMHHQDTRDLNCVDGALMHWSLVDERVSFVRAR